MSDLDPSVLLTEFLKGLLEAALDAEMRTHLKLPDPAHRSRNNSRNGFRSKPLRTDLGDLTIPMPRDRLGTFVPVIVRKRQRSFRAGGELVDYFLDPTIGLENAEWAVTRFYSDHLPEDVRIAVRDALFEAADRFRNSAPFRPQDAYYTV